MCITNAVIHFHSFRIIIEYEKYVGMYSIGSSFDDLNHAHTYR